VAEHCHDHRQARSLHDLDENLVGQIEQFFVSYNAAEGKRFKPVGRHGPHTAEKLVQKGAKRYRAQAAGGNGQPQADGKHKAAKR